MNIYPTADGKFVVAKFMPNKKRFRTCLTDKFTPSEAMHIDDLAGVRKYKNEASAKRAQRKYKDRM